MFVRNKHTAEENEYIMTVAEMSDMFERVITNTLTSDGYQEAMELRMAAVAKPLKEKITALENQLKGVQSEMNLPEADFVTLVENAGAADQGVELPLY